jgi:cell division topological specificity factor
MKRFGFPLWPRKATTAQTAKERLQILLAHERGAGAGPDWLPQLQREIMELVARHVQIDQDAVDVRMERGKEFSSIEINIELPNAARRVTGKTAGV